MHQNPKVLTRFKEYFAAGYFEMPAASPMRRWSRAVRRRFENRTVVAYTGTRLYPSGAWYVPGESTMVVPNHSFTWGYSEKDLEGFQDVDGCPDPDNDNDGVLDVVDLCPYVAEDKEGFFDLDGCPDYDNDYDR